MHTEIIFQHGWGFDSSFWSTFLQPLRSLDATITLGEAGYFGSPPVRPAFSAGDCRKVIIAHSLGLHLIDDAIMQAADLVVALSCFESFHEGSAPQIRRSRRLVSAMLGKLAHSPEAVLQDFYDGCFHPQPSDPHRLFPSIVNRASLTCDLLFLNDHLLASKNLKGTRLLIVHGTEDGIVPFEAAQRLYDVACEAGASTQLMALPGAGHALPLTHSQFCLSFIQPIIAAYCRESPPAPAAELDLQPFNDFEVSHVGSAR
jgi:pimeloyl-ACP methyl ester carboxylesterase